VKYVYIRKMAFKTLKLIRKYLKPQNSGFPAENVAIIDFRRLLLRPEAPKCIVANCIAAGFPTPTGFLPLLCFYSACTNHSAECGCATLNFNIIFI